MGNITHHWETTRLTSEDKGWAELECLPLAGWSCIATQTTTQGAEMSSYSYTTRCTTKEQVHVQSSTSSKSGAVSL